MNRKDIQDLLRRERNLALEHAASVAAPPRQQKKVGAWRQLRERIALEIRKLKEHE